MKNKAAEQASALKLIRTAQAKQRIRNATALKFNSNSNFMKHVRQYNEAWANALRLANANNRAKALSSLAPGHTRILARLETTPRTRNMTNALKNVHKRVNFYLIEYNHPPFQRFIPWRSMVAKNIKNSRASPPRKASPPRTTLPSPQRKALTNYHGSIPGVRNSAHLARLIAAAERKPKNTANLARQLARMGL
jgi:hypothetical protein